MVPMDSFNMYKEVLIFVFCPLLEDCDILHDRSISLLWISIV